jgi:hypothetical protein
MLIFQRSTFSCSNKHFAKLLVAPFVVEIFMVKSFLSTQTLVCFVQAAERRRKFAVFIRGIITYGGAALHYASNVKKQKWKFYASKGINFLQHFTGLLFSSERQRTSLLRCIQASRTFLVVYRYEEQESAG